MRSKLSKKGYFIHSDFEISEYSYLVSKASPLIRQRREFLFGLRRIARLSKREQRRLGLESLLE